MTLRELARRLLHVARRERMSAELEEEMRLHVELRARQQLAAGATAAEAQRQARRSFGDPVRYVEESREQWGVARLDEVLVDARYGARTLRRSPVTALIVIGALAVAVGATVAMFSVMDAALFRPLPVAEPDRLVAIWGGDVPLEGRREAASPTSLSAMRSWRIYDDVGTYAAGGLNLTGGLRPLRVQAGLVTPSVLRLLGVAPLLGRAFTEEEGALGGPDVVVLSHRLWHAQFGADPEVPGRTVLLNDRPYEVVGVMPPRFRFPDGSDLWLPLTIPLSAERAQVFRFIVSTTHIARLAPGVSVEEANAFFATVLQEAGRAGPEPLAATGPHEPLRSFLIGDARMRLLIVMGLTILLLLAACATVSGLLFARWRSRQREIAVRAAIGASRFRLLRQFATEIALVAGAGTLAGLLFAWTGLRVFHLLVPPELAAVAVPQIDGRTLGFALAVALGSALAIGALPALAASRGEPGRALKAGAAPGALRSGGSRLGGGLVVVEAGLAVVLLVASGLLVRTMHRLHAVDTGLRMDGVVTARITLSRASYPEAGERQHFHARLEAELKQQGGLEQVALVSTLPLRGEWHPRVAFDLVDRPDLVRSPFAELVYASPDYFSTMTIPLVSGRSLQPEDVEPGGGALISESLVRTWWPDGSPIGARVTTGGERTHRVIVGVVGDVRGTALDGDQHPQLYLPLSVAREVTIVARSPLPPADALAQVHAAVHRVDAAQVVYDAMTMQQVAAAALTERRTAARLATVLGAVSLSLALLGLYGLLAFRVVQRIPEFGVRRALGAQRSALVGTVVGEGLVLTCIGAAVGLGTALALARLLQSQLYGISPTDTTLLLVVPAILLGTAALAALVPALKAARVDPMTVLRSD